MVRPSPGSNTNGWSPVSSTVWTSKRPSVAAELVELRFLSDEAKDGRDVGVVDVAVRDAHFGPLLPQHRSH
jgi:hypothetical protein